MGIEGSWSGMRKYLEENMLAESLRGRVRYNCTQYAGMEDWHIFEIYIDNRLEKRFSLTEVNSYFISNGYKKDEKPFGELEYWSDFNSILDSVPIQERTEYTDSEFCDALEKYRNQSIDASLDSDNPIEIMFAVLDRRTGKRTLDKYKDSFMNQPQWLQKIFSIRADAKKIN